MKNKKDLLKEWYDTGKVGDGEEVVISNMPDSFQKMRTQVGEPEGPPVEGPIEIPSKQGVEVELEIEKKDREYPEVTMEVKSLNDVYVKTGVFFDTLHSYREALERGDEPMQTEFIKEKLKGLSVDIMRLVDGI